MQLETTAIRKAAAALHERLIEHRRTVHRYPEPGFAEHRTAAYIESVLVRLGIRHERVVGTGVVAVLDGRGPGCIGVRVDIDALPVPEAPGRPGYRSEIDGFSHACGHDAHVAVGLGLAEMLTAMDELPGTVVLYFQPAEEGPGGAAPMVAAGVLDDPAPDAILSVHASSSIASGSVGWRGGPFTGSIDDFDITVHGVGGHAAHPDTAIDPIPVAAEIVTAAQLLATREVDPVQPVVLTFGTIQGGTRHNVIPKKVELTGTLRTLHPANRELLVRRLPELARDVAAAHRATVEVEIEAHYPVGFNHPGLSALVAQAAEAIVGVENVLWEAEPSLGGEDFFAFGDTGIPVAMFHLGVGDAARGLTAPHHSPEFDLDEDALPVGVAVLAEAIRRLLADGVPDGPAA